MGSQDFDMHFLDVALFQDVVHIDDLPFLGDTQIVLGILSSCVIHRPLRRQARLLISFGAKGLLFMEDCAPFIV
jgi:hypothetical protein